MPAAGPVKAGGGVGATGGLVIHALRRVLYSQHIELV